MWELLLEQPTSAFPSAHDPSSLELLYGSSKNFLASRIHEATRFWPTCDAQRLAGGLLTYNFVKWLTRHSLENSAFLRPIQWPVQGQLQRLHPSGIDFIVWPAPSAADPIAPAVSASTAIVPALTLRIMSGTMKGLQVRAKEAKGL
ncbi:hypothetical protein BJX64DRAFT_294299 [Aspergillus heterothallicus]